MPPDGHSSARWRAEPDSGGGDAEARDGTDVRAGTDALDAAARTGAGAPGRGIVTTRPSFKIEVSDRPFATASAWTPTPADAAIAQRVSPATTVFWVPCRDALAEAAAVAWE